MQTIEQTRFGTLEYAPDDIVTFNDGLIGFDHCTRFLVLDLGHKGSFRWLQSVDEPSLAFLVVDPAEYIEGYGLELSDDEVNELSIGDDTATMLFTTASIPPSRPRDMTINLAGPIVINADARIGKQVVVDDETVPVRYRVFGEQQIAKAA